MRTSNSDSTSDLRRRATLRIERGPGRRQRGPLRFGHDPHQRMKARRGAPAEEAAALLGVAAAVRDVGRAEEGGVAVDVRAPVETELGEGEGDELLERMT